MENKHNQMREECVRGIATMVMDVIAKYGNKCSFDSAAGYIAAVVEEAYHKTSKFTPEQEKKVDDLQKQFYELVMGLGKVQGLSVGEMLVVIWNVTSRISVMMGKAIDYETICPQCPNYSIEGGVNE